MTATVKSKSGLTVPPTVQRKAGFKIGDEVEFRVSGGVIAILPKAAPVEVEYTPEQRRAIDAELDQAAEGPFHGPFHSADEMIAHMKGELRKRAAAKRAKRSR